MFAAVEHRPQMLDGVEDVDGADVQRGEAEADDVGRTEVADHATGDQRMNDPIGVLVPQRDLAAAPGVLTGRDDSELTVRDARRRARGRGR
jgi:hypothetical protein